MKKKNIKGQSFFEIMVAMAIMSLVVIAIVKLATTAVRNNTFSRNKTQANEYAQEAVEWLRKSRDDSWAQFKAKAQQDKTFCFRKDLSDPGWPGIGQEPCFGKFIEDENGDDTIFIREVALSMPDDDTANADITVVWNDAQGEHEVRLMTIFTNWK